MLLGSGLFTIVSHPKPIAMTSSILERMLLAD
jgi:hypothetical protein